MIKKRFGTFLITILITLICLSSLSQHVVASSAAPGVMGNPPDRRNIPWEYKVKRPWIFNPSPLGDECMSWTPTCTGVVIKTDFPNDAYLDGPDIPFIPKSSYIKEINLKIEQIISYEPLIYLKSESWYDHRITIESLTSTKTTLQLDLSLGKKSNSWAASLSGGGSITTVKTQIVSWSVTASGGHDKVIYVKMIFLHIEGTIKYNNNQVRYYDILITEAIEFLNIEIITDGYERPNFKTKLYDGADIGSTADKFYNLGDSFTWTNSKEKTISTYVGIDVKLGGSEGFFLKGSGKFTYSKTSKFTVQHVFINKGMPSNILYFYIAFNNFYSINLVPVIGSTGGGGGGGGPLLQ